MAAVPDAPGLYTKIEYRPATEASGMADRMTRGDKPLLDSTAQYRPAQSLP